ncbi:MAG: ABC transporter substrate-binding protein [Oligoflexia bacterium]|nr:ABC transporter substrate-binding protein [Oligoflexia bacterium]
MKKFNFLTFQNYKVIFCFLLFLVVGIAQADAASKVYKVGILQTSASLDNAVDGFKAGMKELGYIEGKNIEYEYKNANAVPQNIIEYAEYFAKSDKDLIFSCATPTTKALKLATSKEKKQIPVVFTPVSDPVAAGIVSSWDSSGCNLTGVASGVVTGEQLKILKEIFPNIKKVLVLSKKGDPSSEAGLKNIIEIVEKAQKDSKNILNGIELLVERPVSKVDVMDLLQKQDFSKIDAVHIPADTMIGDLVDAIYEKTKSKNIPIIVHDPSLFKKGGFLSYVSDYYLLAKNQVARQAHKILKDAKNPAEIAVEQPQEYFLHLNLKAVNITKDKIPTKYREKVKYY